jgi:cyclophilin family peptidyl-prolyl cis-trans isomerase
MNTEQMLAKIIQQSKEEILQDINSDVVPKNVTSFAQLQDYVDANCYGGLCEDKLFDELLEHFGGRDEHEGMPEGMIDFINKVQTSIDVWLRNGMK